MVGLLHLFTSKLTKLSMNPDQALHIGVGTRNRCVSASCRGLALARECERYVIREKDINYRYR